jgi:hypothetical protein
MNIAADLATLSLSSWLGSATIGQSFAAIVEALTWKRSCRRPLFSIKDQHESREVHVAVATNVVTVPHAPPAVAAGETGSSEPNFNLNDVFRFFAILQ